MSQISSVMIGSPSATEQGGPFDRVLFTGNADAAGKKSSIRSEVERQDDFAAIMARGKAKPGQTPEQTARAGAEQFVALTLVQPILKQLRESDHTAPPFAPSQGEKQFRSLMDAEVAQRVVHAAHFPLVDRLARDMLGHGGAGAHALPRAKGLKAEPKA